MSVLFFCPPVQVWGIDSVVQTDDTYGFRAVSCPLSPTPRVKPPRNDALEPRHDRPGEVRKNIKNTTLTGARLEHLSLDA